MSPTEMALVTKILAGAGAVFVIAYVGNLISFSNRFVNALVTALVFAVVYGALYFLVDQTMLPPELQAISQATYFRMIAISSGLVFVLDLVANVFSFSNRLVNALVTAALFAVLFGYLSYATLAN
jgi:hypothetical protein